MKRILAIALVLCAALPLQAQKRGKSVEPQQLTEWNDIDIFEQNVRYPRANVVPYANENGIEQWKYKSSVNYFALNGTWAMRVDNSVDSRPNPEDKTFSTEGWNKVNIPAAKILDGTKTVTSPLVKNPNQLPNSGNALTTYSRTIDVPKVWAD